MSFPKSFLEELKARIRVSDVVGRKVKLKRHGREFMGLSPFSNEKTPSFTVNDEKQFYHCFSTGEHGDVIKFLEKTENLSFLEAVERLAAEAGLEMPQRDPRAAEREKQQTGLIDVMKMAQDYFRAGLTRGHGAEARAYLQRRGLKAETVERFGLGYAPDQRHGLLKTLQAQGVKISQMIEAGLIIGGEDIKEPYDRFRNRLMFPIEDARGRVIAFGGRALDPDARAKYLNSPETPLFHKGHVLYNYARARKAAYDAGTVIACEGYMDVIALAQAGFEHAVAPLGTAMTENQIDLLWRLAPEPILCFDGDKAGVKAAFRAVERALPLLRPGHSLRFALLPEGKDPDDLIKEEGTEAMRAVLEKARPLIDMVWDKEMEGGRWDTPERRAQLEARIEAVAQAIQEPRVRGHYATALRERLRTLFSPTPSGGFAGQGQNRFQPGRGGGRWQGQGPGNRRGQGGKSGRFQGFMPPASPELRRSALVRGGDPGRRNREMLLTATLLNHPALLERYCEEFAHLQFEDRELDKIRNEIIDIAALHAPLEREALGDHLNHRGFSELARRLTHAPSLMSERFARIDASVEEAEHGFLHLLHRHRHASDLQTELKAAERALAEEMTEENLARLKAVQAELGGFSNSE
ncbi:DNA primase [Tepidicaulis marinus]|uniref:DNA primase n=2 Tax=Tepidicaulis TaxID=1742977 RepID=A0A081BF72_9HYPH|nr:DNA primase [Tepidicaulis marinus]GAK46690.1 DNA primase [Tepidicaulis marinus]